MARAKVYDLGPSTPQAVLDIKRKIVQAKVVACYHELSHGRWWDRVTVEHPAAIERANYIMRGDYAARYEEQWAYEAQETAWSIYTMLVKHGINFGSIA